MAGYVANNVRFALSHTDCVSREHEACYLEHPLDTITNTTHMNQLRANVDAAVAKEPDLSTTSNPEEDLPQCIPECMGIRGGCQRRLCTACRSRNLLSSNQAWYSETDAQRGEPCYAWQCQELSEEHRSLADMECKFQSGVLPYASYGTQVQDCDAILQSDVGNESIPSSVAAMIKRHSGTGNSERNNGRQDSKVDSDIFPDEDTPSSTRSSEPASHAKT